ncbi:MAG: GNAT family N-acetyltransferase [Methanomassiliicoccales archaeon]
MKSRVITSLDELRDFREDWETLRLRCHAPIFSSFDLVYLWLENFKIGASPRVVVVEEKGELVGVAPLFVYKHKAMGLPVTTISLVGNHRHFTGYSLESVLAKDGEPEILREMLRRTKSIRWNLMQLFDMEPNIGNLRFLDGIKAEMEWEPHAEKIDRLYEFPEKGHITDGFGWRTRKNLRTIWNKLEREGRMAFRTLCSEEDMEKAMWLYIEQHKERWRNRGGSIFQKPREGRLLIEMAKLAGRRRIGVMQELLIDGEVAGQLFSFFDGEVSRAYRMGMAEKFRELSPGRLVMTLAMEDHRARGLKAMDLLHGDEEYKLHLTNKERRLQAVQVSRGSLRTLSRIRAFPPIKLIDERLGIRERMLKRVYTG